MEKNGFMLPSLSSDKQDILIDKATYLVLAAEDVASQREQWVRDEAREAAIKQETFKIAAGGLVINQDRLTWKRAGACYGNAETEIFYPDTSDEKDPRVIKAKAACGSCAVSATCLEYSLTHREKYGIWGGLTERERRRILRQRRKSA